MRWKTPPLATLDLYVLHRFFGIYLACLSSFTLIFVLIDTVMRSDDFLRVRQGFAAAFRTWVSYYVGMTPVIFCQILGPIITVTAAIFTVTTLQRANEFTPMLATGRSYQRTLLPILAASLFVCAGVFLIQELWLPRSAASLRETVEVLDQRRLERDVKHLDQATGQFIVFREYERFQRRASGVLVLPVFSSTASLSGRGRQLLIHARSAEWREISTPVRGAPTGYWLLRDGSVQEWDEDFLSVVHPPSPQQENARPQLALPFVERKLETGMIPEDLGRREAGQMSLAQLRRKAETTPQHGVWAVRYYSRFAYAATNFILVLLGLPIIIAFANRNLIFGALIAVAIASAYFVVNSVCQDLGVRGRMSAALGGALAPLLFTALGATFYRNIKS